MKYIDADKLIAEIKTRKNAEGWCPVGGDTAEVYYARGFRFACDFVLNTIISLQKEPPEEICPRCVYRNKTEDSCEYPYGGKECYINENGVYKCNGFEAVEHQEQPESTCKTCGFYENNCPFIRGKLIPYPNRVCKDYIYSAMKVQEQPAVDLEINLGNEVENFCLEYDARKDAWYNMTPRDQKLLSKPTWLNFAMNIARHFYKLGINARKEE